jgi:peptidoglycan/LPS O-acetylase OafA/YrhL
VGSIPIARSIPSPSARIPGLDGIRALAVLLVVLYHLNLLGVGWIGVQFFFVLSGFLITRLLLELRDGRSLGAYLKTFLGRRVLRIFPLYYLYLLLVLAAATAGVLAPAQADAVTSQWGYAATYLYNWWGTTRFHERSIFLDHLWSLAIEEQFYLLWPFVVFWLSPRTLLRVVVALVAAGPLLRYGVFATWPLLDIADPNRLAYAVAVCTLSQLDAFALGAVLCFVGERAASLRRPALWLAGTAVLVVTLGYAASGAGLAPLQRFGAPLTLGFPNTLPAHYQFVWGFSAVNLFAALLITLAAWRNAGATLLQHPWTEYVGRISYGIYVWHFPLAHLTSPWVFEIRQLTGAGFYACLLMFAPVYLALLLGLSALSYELYERRFLLLKRHWFPG